MHAWFMIMVLQNIYFYKFEKESNLLNSNSSSSHILSILNSKYFNTQTDFVLKILIILTDNPNFIFRVKWIITIFQRPI